MDFESARRQFQRLSRLFRDGAISQEEFVEGVDDLTVFDQDGTEWQIGMQTGSWYRRQGEAWIEDQPTAKNIPINPDRLEQTAGPDRGRRFIYAVILLVLLLLFLFGANYLSGRNAEDAPITGPGAGTGDLQTLAVSQATETQPPDQAGEDAGEDQATPTATQGGPAATPTETLLPPPPRVPPQVWRVRSEIAFSGPGSLSNEWGFVPEEDWEYEFLNYEGSSSLFLQFTEPAALWHAGGESFRNTDRSLKLALTNAAGRVWMTCRYDRDAQTGYALRLSRERWTLVDVVNGADVILAQGDQSDAFENGGYETFRLRCADNQISAWDSRGLLANAADDRMDAGPLGLLFGLEQGVGVAVIAEDRVAVLQGEDRAAAVGDSVWLDTVEIELIEVYQSASAEGIIGINLRIANWTESPVGISAEKIYLQSGEQRVYPVDFVPQGVSESQLLELPAVLTAEERNGEVYFAGISSPGGWQLVVDLRYEGYGEARFNLGE